MQIEKKHELYVRFYLQLFRTIIFDDLLGLGLFDSVVRWEETQIPLS